MIKFKPPSIEKQLENKCVRRCKALGWECLKLRVVGAGGFMDRSVFTASGRWFIIEFKDRGKRGDPKQRAFRRRMIAVGQQPLLIDTVEKLELFFFHAIHSIPIPDQSDLTRFD